MTAAGRDGRGIVWVEREPGDVAGEVCLGRTTPSYSIDSGGRICFLTDSRTLQWFRFRSTPSNPCVHTHPAAERAPVWNLLSPSSKNLNRYAA